MILGVPLRSLDLLIGLLTGRARIFHDFLRSRLGLSRHLRCFGLSRRNDLLRLLLGAGLGRLL